jgi:structural maintenance of chromosome 1
MHLNTFSHLPTLHVHMYFLRRRSAPFFVLDEVDAALDQYNVSRVAAYLRARSTGAVPGLSGAAAGIGSRRGAAAGDAPLQCIVISLKDALYSEADALVGVYRNAEAKSSALVTLDLQPYRKAEEDVDDEETAEGELV